MVAGKPIESATSISLIDIWPGRCSRCKNKLLPTPAVPVTVPALLTIVPATSPRSSFCVIETAGADQLIVILDPPLARLIFDPPTSVDAAGPEMVKLCAPAPTLTPPAPETFNRVENVPDELPVVFPSAVRETVPAAAPAPTIVIDPAPVLRVIFAPAARTIVPVDVAAPVPKAETTFAVEAETENEPFPAPILTIPIPDIARTLFIVPDDVAPVVLPEAEREMVEKLVAIGAEIVMLCAPTPTLTAPAPEMFTRFVCVPEELTVVFPRADIETEAV